MKYRLLIILFSCLPFFSMAQVGSDNDPRTQFVGLMNGQKVYAKRVQLKNPFLKGSYFLLDDTLRYPLNSVKYYQNDNGYFLRISNPYDRDDFAKRTISGRISKYYVSKTYYNNMYGPYGGYGGYGYGGFGGYGWGMPSSRNIYFFTKDDGELQSYNFNNLREALADNPGSVQLLNQYRKGKYVETGVSIAGAAILLYGMSQTFKNYQNSQGQGGSVAPTVYVGAAVISLPWITGLFKKDKITQAVELYNYNQRTN